MIPSIAIVYHSAFGHTARVAEAVALGVQDAEVRVLDVEALDEAGWQALDEADAIVFGCPTYMGGVSAVFKSFIDATSKRWLEQRWKNKIAAGFTNSGAYNGDKLSTLTQLALNAMQHGMIWVGTAQMNEGGTGPDGINRLGSFLGLMTFSTNESPEVTPPSGDLKTAELFGRRIEEMTWQFLNGKIA